MKLLAKFDVFGLGVVPWTPPQVFMKTTKDGRRFKSAAKDKRLEAWQDYVRLHAKESMTGKQVWTGPTFMRLEFFKKAPKGVRHNSLWFNGVKWDGVKAKFTKAGTPVPDLDNLFKGTQDALEGELFGNDVQTCILNASRRYGPKDGVRVTVWTIEEGDEAGDETTD